jgi:hypothetical protein
MTTQVARALTAHEGKFRLYSLADFDQRSRASREAGEFLDALAREQNGEISAAKRELAEGAAMLRQMRRHVWVCFQRGEPLDPALVALIGSLATVCNTQKRQLEGIGLDRAPDPVPTIEQFVTQYREREAQAALLKASEPPPDVQELNENRSEIEQPPAADVPNAFGAPPPASDFQISPAMGGSAFESAAEAEDVPGPPRGSHIERGDIPRSRDFDDPNAMKGARVWAGPEPVPQREDD